MEEKKIKFKINDLVSVIKYQDINGNILTPKSEIYFIREINGDKLTIAYKSGKFNYDLGVLNIKNIKPYKEEE